MLNDDQWNELLHNFLAEAEELVQRAEMALARLQDDLNDPDAINDLFRAVHTLKGGAGLLNLDGIVAFTHEFESVLMRVRDGDALLDPTLVRLGLRCVDRIAALLEPLERDGEASDAAPERTAELLAALAAYRPAGATAVLEPESAPVPAAASPRGSLWYLSLRFDPALFLNGFDPASFLRYMEKLGRIVDLVLLDTLPDEAAFNPECCYLGADLVFDSPAPAEDIDGVFDLLDDLAQVRLVAPGSDIADYLDTLTALPGEDPRLGDILVGNGLLSRSQLEQHLQLDNALREPGSRSDALSAATTRTAAQATPARTERRAGTDKRPADTAAYLRISAAKMDELISQVGELVIAAAGARMKTDQHTDPGLHQSLEDIHQHVESIREAALQLRMVEIGESFNRFHRVVRDTADNLGKSIQLVIAGAETELDKTLVDRIHEPLVHLVRNAIDHGIETAEQRRVTAKPDEGRVRLNAYHDAGMIVIEVGDDGRGIDTEVVRRKAEEQGLITADEVLDDQSLLQLIFHPGFSTAEAVTNLSGRGVGMDSVKRTIDGLRGTLEVDNRPGEGCCIRIRLPLTLAIIDGFLITLRGQHFVVPLDAVQECIESQELNQRQARGGIRDLRGQALPCLDLERAFGLTGDSQARQSLLVVGHGQENAGVLVDHLHGEVQTVIKPLGALFEHLSGVSGATILGSGEVALILDVPGLLRLSQTQTTQAPARPSATALDGAPNPNERRTLV